MHGPARLAKLKSRRLSGSIVEPVAELAKRGANTIPPAERRRTPRGH
jgi:hypothetical protein